jgi:GTP-binding protein Era
MTQLIEAAKWPFEHYFPVSALAGDGVADLVAEIVARLPEGPPYYPPDMASDLPEAMVIAELVREKFLDRLREELPHALVVRVEEISTRDDGSVDIAADVIVERDSQKGIVIGRGGGLLGAAGSDAREELETLLGAKVNLHLRVVVEKDWQRTPQLLDRLGFEEGA